MPIVRMVCNPRHGYAVRFGTGVFAHTRKGKSMENGEHRDVEVVGVNGYIAVTRTWKGYYACQRADPRYHGTLRYARTSLYETEVAAIAAIAATSVNVEGCGAAAPQRLKERDGRPVLGGRMPPS